MTEIALVDVCRRRYIDHDWQMTPIDIQIRTKLCRHLTKKHSHLWRNVVRKLNGPSHHKDILIIIFIFHPMVTGD
ncbi:hypothetical protein DPMN_193202 [Dreissena polymorpha]|uniref:Uncharacterized protein n=1 Tax=Dreissena polymorpha TaxID=45954 RepID=A0A9D3Y1C4_DREPO|nr:hypothetical protein DPMN_193202 [Dreissena polymorpha]